VIRKTAERMQKNCRKTAEKRLARFWQEDCKGYVGFCFMNFQKKLVFLQFKTAVFSKKLQYFFHWANKLNGKVSP